MLGSMWGTIVVRRRRPKITLPPGERLYTIRDVAAHLRVTPETVRGWVRAGKLAGSKPGSSWLVRGADLERFVAGYRPPRSSLHVLDEGQADPAIIAVGEPIRQGDSAAVGAGTGTVVAELAPVEKRRLP